MRDLLRLLGVLLLFAIGAVHLYEYVADDYRLIPTIGVLFLINFAAAMVLGLLLACPLRFLPSIRSIPVTRQAAHALVALAAIAFAAGTIAGLLISEQSMLFGFQELGYRTVIKLALGLESGAIVVLAGFLALETHRIRTHPSPEAGIRPRQGPRGER